MKTKIIATVVVIIAVIIGATFAALYFTTYNNLVEAPEADGNLRG
jgi:hypothetical protein